MSWRLCSKYLMISVPLQPTRLNSAAMLVIIGCHIDATLGCMIMRGQVMCPDCWGRESKWKIHGVCSKQLKLAIWSLIGKQKSTFLAICGGFEVDRVAHFHIPAFATYFISLLFLWQNCGRIFVMVLKGLSASKLRELVVQPISETTQSFQHWQEWARACGQNSPAKLPIQSFYIKLGEAHLHVPLTSALIHPKPLLQPPQHLREEIQ